jgi:uncharacterized DUF497 family protein
VRFEWDDAKSAANLRKHGVSFDEATEVFSDPFVLMRKDAAHSYEEERLFVVGYSVARMLYVAYTERRGEMIRIISARLPTSAERKAYEEQER